MNLAGIVVTFSLCVTIIICLATLFLLWRVPSSPTRNLAILLMVLIVPASVLMLLGILENLGGRLIYTASVSDLLIYWSLPLILQLTLRFARPKGIDSRTAGNIAIYLPMIVLTLSLGLMAISGHSGITVVDSSAPPFAVLGALNLMFISVGVLYIILAIFIISWKLWSGAGPVKKSLQMILGIFLITIFSGLLLMLLDTNISISALYSIVGSLLGLVFSNAAVTQSILIVPQREQRSVDLPVDLLGPGAIYLFLRKKERARELFVLYLKSGKQGLWITRRPPREARELYGLEKTPFLWLTSSPVQGENCIDPGEFGQLLTAISKFIREAKDYMILIEGMEYIITKTGFNTVLKLIQHLNDQMMSTGGILLMGLNPNALNGNELSLLESEAAGVFEETEPANIRAQTSRNG